MLFTGGKAAGASDLLSFRLPDQSNIHLKSTGLRASRLLALRDETSNRSHDATTTQACVIRSWNGRFWALDSQLRVVNDACLRHRLRGRTLRIKSMTQSCVMGLDLKTNGR